METLSVLTYIYRRHYSCVGLTFLVSEVLLFPSVFKCSSPISAVTF